ncbi:hypothetical protein M378DRAFT_996960 [Amanita muscaria Koide BX008]|uniref:Uncharacterized protein n=1 Tax=Amanita muscaria (strain Koide BX008) TaxID=946122 RepID=A0A0C2SZW1_AMAMK|nr:hypothetical protein M378DRAFT_996960 [Amanita muscaria Koide BX008]
MNTNMDVTHVALRSKAFPGKYLRMDGQGLTRFIGTGGGKVNTSDFIGPDETLVLERFDNGTVSFQSAVFDNVYLRLDRGSITKGKNFPNGGGVVNCQFGSVTSEKFKIVQKKPTKRDKYDGTVGIESSQFPGRFLRMDGGKDQVNVQGVLSSFEEWEILVIA